ncbi:unnamed protein product [Ectocarpus sp. 6 AP-2014]
MMDEDPLAAILGEEEVHESEFLPGKNKGPKFDGGIDPEILAPDLLAACKENNDARAQDFLADGVPPGYSDPESGWSCLHWSVYNGNPMLTRALVRAGATSGYKRASNVLTQGRKAHKQVNARRGPSSSLPISDTPLHWSAYRGDLGITWILLKEGYSPNDMDNMGNTATHLAAANGHERVLDTLIRDGADVHRQNKFKNTPHDVANSAECRGILRRAEALPAPSVEEAEKMHTENLQRILEVERVLAEVVGPLEPTDDEDRRQKRKLQQLQGINQAKDVDNRDDEELGEGRVGDEVTGGAVGAIATGGQAAGEGEGGGSDGGKGEDDPSNGGGENGPDSQGRHSAAEEKTGGEGRMDAKETDGDGGDGYKADGMNNGDGGERRQGDVGIEAHGTEGKEPDRGSGGSIGELSEDLLGQQVELIREAVAGAEALCICEDLVAAARLRIDGLLLQHSIEIQQATKVAAEGPILTQQAYTTLVNRLMLLLRRAEGNSRISSKLKKRAKALVDKSHGEYWLQVSAQRLLKVECAEARHMADMAKLEARIEKAAKVEAHPQLVQDCRSLLKRLTTEVEISKAILGFPTVRLPIDPMPKDYWQPEDIGHIEENEGFPLPPVDADGKNMEYVWVPSKSLRALSAACKRMSEALVGGEGLNPALVERGSKKLQEFQKELKVLTEKDTADKDKAISVAAKAAKKKKKKGGGGKKKKK